jgi:hypothetical protein
MNAKLLVQIFVLVAMSGTLSFAATKPEEDAQKSAEQWLALVDAGKYSQSWKETAPYFQRSVPQDQWEVNGKHIRASFGNLHSRKLKSAQYTKSVPGAPDGEYVILKYDTSFANKREAVETITPMRDKDGRWKVSGYFIK